MEGKIILITGGTGQIGRVLCKVLLAEGAQVVTHYRTETRREELEEFVGADLAVNLHLSARDPLSPDDVSSWIHETLAVLGRIDGAVHTIGGIHPRQPAHQLAIETWTQSLALNLDSAFFLARALLPHFLERGQGKLVFVSALAGLKGKAQYAAYSAAKGGLIRFAEALAEETKRHNVQVNVVAPGILRTPANLSWGSTEDAQNWVEPERFARTVLFLLSPDGDDITGATLPVTGGM